MPRTKPKPKPAPESPKTEAPVAAAGEVLTLAEAAEYLKSPESDVLAAVASQGLPGRMVAGEWRFLKSAIQQWLSTGPEPTSNKEAWLALAGVWKDDPISEAELKEIHRRRGRSTTG